MPNTGFHVCYILKVALIAQAASNTTDSTRITRTMSLLEQCIVPRLRISAADAIYCAKFVELVHSLVDGETFNMTVYLQM